MLKVHPSNYRIDGFVEGTSVSELATLGLPVVVDIGSGLLDASVPWLTGPPPAWLAGEPAAVQTLADGAALVTFSGDKLLGGPQAGIIAGRADLVAACAAHPLARALRPGGLVLGSLQDVALAYLRRDAAVTIPFWRMVDAPVTVLRDRAMRIVTEAGVGEAVATEALPGAGSAPGVTMPSYGVALDGDHLAGLRAAPTPIVGRVRDQRTYLDLRGVDPEDDADLVHALRATSRSRRSSVDEGRRHCRARRSREVVAGAGADRHRSRSLRGGEAARAHDRSRVSPTRRCRRGPGSASSTSLAMCGSCATCWPESAESTLACSWSPRPRGGSRSRRSTSASSNCSAIGHGVIALTKVDLVDDEGRELALLDVGDHVAETFLQGARVVPVSATTGEGLDDLRAALDDLVATTPQAVDRSRPRLWIDRVFAAKGSGTVVTGTLTGGSLTRDHAVVIEPGGRSARVRSIQIVRVGDRPHRTRQPRRR